MGFGWYRVAQVWQGTTVDCVSRSNDVARFLLSENLRKMMDFASRPGNDVLLHKVRWNANPILSISLTRSTFPGPTEGSWSGSPTMITSVSDGSALKRAWVRAKSIILNSSTTNSLQLSGFSSFRWKVKPAAHSNKRWTVHAGMPESSCNRTAALPVGAHTRVGN